MDWRADVNCESTVLEFKRDVLGIQPIEMRLPWLLFSQQTAWDELVKLSALLPFPITSLYSPATRSQSQDRNGRAIEADQSTNLRQGDTEKFQNDAKKTSRMRRGFFDGVAALNGTCVALSRRGPRWLGTFGV